MKRMRKMRMTTPYLYLLIDFTPRVSSFSGSLVGCLMVPGFKGILSLDIWSTMLNGILGSRVLLGLVYLEIFSVWYLVPGVNPYQSFISILAAVLLPRKSDRENKKRKEKKSHVLQLQSIILYPEI